MRRIISILIILAISSMAFLSSCTEEDQEQQYKTYSVEYLLQNNMSEDKRFIITYKDPAYANKITEQYESIQDTFWIRIEAKSLDVLYLSGETKNDSANYSVSIYVDSELIIYDSTSCSWQCESTFVEVEFPLP
ncbi:MAG: hypothetical protein GQ527_01320 [Bacteroidales bacterium]|nr:hypothetical protein [Bacteroidales bacterium]